MLILRGCYYFFFFHAINQELKILSCILRFAAVWLTSYRRFQKNSKMRNSQLNFLLGSHFEFQNISKQSNLKNSFRKSKKAYKMVILARFDKIGEND